MRLEKQNKCDTSNSWSEIGKLLAAGSAQCRLHPPGLSCSCQINVSPTLRSGQRYTPTDGSTFFFEELYQIIVLHPPPLSLSLLPPAKGDIASWDQFCCIATPTSLAVGAPLEPKLRWGEVEEPLSAFVTHRFFLYVCCHAFCHVSPPHKISIKTAISILWQQAQRVFPSLPHLSCEGADMASWGAPGPGPGPGPGAGPGPGPGPGPTSLTTKVELTISCENLMDMDVFSKSDPLCALYLNTGSHWYEVCIGTYPTFEAQSVFCWSESVPVIWRPALGKSTGRESQVSYHPGCVVRTSWH